MSDQIAYATIKVSKELTGSSNVRLKSGKKTTVRKSKLLGEIPYERVTKISVKLALAKPEKFTIEFGGLNLIEAEHVSKLLEKGNRVHAVWGVKGRWSVTKVYRVQDIKAKYGKSITMTFIAMDVGVKLSQTEMNKNYLNKPVSNIVKDIAKLNNMKSVITIKQDPRINLTSSRRSPIEILTHIANKYGYALRFDDDTVYFEEFNIDAKNSVGTFVYGGIGGNIIEFTYDSALKGKEGTNTIAKRRSSKKSSKSPDNYDVGITYSGTSHTAAKRKINAAKTGTKPVTGETPGISNSRTVPTVNKGKAAQREAFGSQIGRLRRVTVGTLKLMNAYFRRVNDTLMVTRVATLQAGRYYIHEINYTLQKGFWDIKLKIGRVPAKKKGNPLAQKKNLKNKKGSKGPLKTRVKLDYYKNYTVAKIEEVKPKTGK